MRPDLTLIHSGNVISTAAAAARAIAVAASQPLRRQASVHRLRKLDLGRRPGVSSEERLHLWRGVYYSVGVLVLQTVLR